jgi:putative membrane protein
MRFLVWVVRALVFFTLFAFALNNQQDAAVHWFFGYGWRGPMVFIVLSSFALGCAFGVFAMVPSWWKHRRVARQQQSGQDQTPPLEAPLPGTSEPMLDHPPRDGL